MYPVGKHVAIQNGKMYERTRPEYNTATEMVLKLMESGVPVKEAYKVVNGKEPSIHTVYGYNARYKKYTLKSNRAIKAMYKGIVSYAEGKEINGISPDCNTVIKACGMIADRVEPAVKLNASIEHTYIDICIDDAKDMLSVQDRSNDSSNELQTGVGEGAWELESKMSQDCFDARRNFLLESSHG